MIRILVLALLIAVAPPGAAHDFWLEPAPLQPAPNAPVSLRLFVGHASDPEPFGYRADHAARFEILPARGDAAEAARPATRPGQRPAGLWKAPKAGARIAVYVSTGSVTTLDGPKFTGYLREEGLTEALAVREREGAQADPATERFVRCAKALIAVGATPATDRAVGLDYELVVTDSLGSWKPGRALTLEARTPAGPQSGRKVELIALDAPDTASLVGVTDEAGRVRLTPPAAGRWLATSVRMERYQGSDDVAWQSHWASTVFYLGHGPEAERPPTTRR